MKQIDKKQLYKGFFTINQQIVEKKDGTNLEIRADESFNLIEGKD